MYHCRKCTNMRHPKYWDKVWNVCTFIHSLDISCNTDWYLHCVKDKFNNWRGTEHLNPIT
jgi:hypothetical protein